MKRFIFAFILLVPHFAFSHPVSFEGGTAFMGEMSEPLQNYYLIYSPKWWFSTGGVVESVDQERVYSSGQLGFLLKRWNQEHAQGNIYLFGGPGYYTNRVNGVVIDDGGFTRMGIQADYETRRLYFNARYVERRTWDKFDALDNLIDVAVGFAPFLANTQDVNMWFVLRYMAGEKMREDMVAPTVKFFYRNYLWEVGMSTTGNAQVNFMIHM